MAHLPTMLHRLALAPLASLLTEAAIAQAAPPAPPEPAPQTISGVAAVERTYLERAAITAADQKCSLFTDGERMALTSGLYQARNELLRADYAIAEIEALTDEVSTHARTLGCDHPSIQNVSSTIRDSYRQFVKTSFLEFPGRAAFWEASRSEHDAWAVRQPEAKSGAVLGLRRAEPQSRRPSIGPADTRKTLQLAVSIPATSRAPSTVQLLVRDPAKLSEPWINGLTGSNNQLTPPPRAVATPLWAGRQSNEWDVVKDPIYVFYFGNDAIERLEALDPREAVTLQLTPSPRAAEQSPTRIVFEAGDFAAARAFAMIPKAQQSDSAAPEQAAAAH